MATSTPYTLFTSLEMCMNSAATTRGRSPASLGADPSRPPVLSRLCVLPDPVCPYASMLPLYPCKTSRSTGFPTASYTLFWSASGSKTPSYWKSLAVLRASAAPPASTRSMAPSSSSVTVTLLVLLSMCTHALSPSSRARNGRDRAYTRTRPFVIDKYLSSSERERERE